MTGVDNYKEWWHDQLRNAGYDTLYTRRSGMHPDGLVTAFRRDIFQLFRSENVELNDISEYVQDPNAAARCHQDNVAQIVALQPWEECDFPSALVVANTFFSSPGNPWDPAGDDVKMLQVR
jgi:mRNA deadenylase 3'-5' endonuclease subunit Ccr4